MNAVAPTPYCSEIQTIKEIVARTFDIRVFDLDGGKRDRRNVRPRQVAMYLANLCTTATLPMIGRAFGGRDHTTVMHAVRRVKVYADHELDMRAAIQALEAEVWETLGRNSRYAQTLSGSAADHAAALVRVKAISGAVLSGPPKAVEAVLKGAGETKVAEGLDRDGQPFRLYAATETGAWSKVVVGHGIAHIVDCGTGWTAPAVPKKPQVLCITCRQPYDSGNKGVRICPSCRAKQKRLNVPRIPRVPL